jgi:hypothetical protein
MKCQAWHTVFEPEYELHRHRPSKQHDREMPPTTGEAFRRLVEEGE